MSKRYFDFSAIQSEPVDTLKLVKERVKNISFATYHWVTDGSWPADEAFQVIHIKDRMKAIDLFKEHLESDRPFPDNSSRVKRILFLKWLEENSIRTTKQFQDYWDTLIVTEPPQPVTTSHIIENFRELSVDGEVDVRVGPDGLITMPTERTLQLRRSWGEPV